MIINEIEKNIKKNNVLKIKMDRVQKKIENIEEFREGIYEDINYMYSKQTNYNIFISKVKVEHSSYLLNLTRKGFSLQDLYTNKCTMQCYMDYMEHLFLKKIHFDRFRKIILSLKKEKLLEITDNMNSFFMSNPKTDFRMKKCGKYMPKIKFYYDCKIKYKKGIFRIDEEGELYLNKSRMDPNYINDLISMEQGYDEINLLLDEKINELSQIEKEWKKAKIRFTNIFSEILVAREI